MAQQKFTVKVAKGLDAETRAAIAVDIIDHIIERTQKGKDKKGKDFKGYSDSYKGSFDFKLAGKGKKVNLTLSGEMLNALTLLDSAPGSLTIGIPADDDFNNAKAEGNIKGTYGQDAPIRGKKRDFMGIQRTELTKIKEKYKDGGEEAVFNTLRAAAAAGIAENILDIE